MASQQPSFTTPHEAIEFIRLCLEQNETNKLFSAFTGAVSEFWKDRLIQSLRLIEAADSLERIFLEEGRITTFPDQENVLNLGGHNPRTHYLHLKLVKVGSGWVLDSIHVCR